MTRTYFGLADADGLLVQTAHGAPALEPGRLGARRALDRFRTPSTPPLRVVPVTVTVDADIPTAPADAVNTFARMSGEAPTLFALQMRNGRLVRTLTGVPHLFPTPTRALDAVDLLRCRRTTVVAVSIAAHAA